MPTTSKPPSSASSSYEVNKNIHKLWVESYSYLFLTNGWKMNWDLTSLPLLETYFILRSRGLLSCRTPYGPIDESHSVDYAKKLSKSDIYLGIKSPFTKTKANEIIDQDVIPFIDYLIATGQTPIYYKSEFLDLIFVDLRMKIYKKKFYFVTCITPYQFCKYIATPKMSETLSPNEVDEEVSSDAAPMSVLPDDLQVDKVAELDVDTLCLETIEQLKELKVILKEFIKNPWEIKFGPQQNPYLSIFLNAINHPPDSQQPLQLPFTYTKILKLCELKGDTLDAHTYVNNPREARIHSNAKDIISSCVRDLITDDSIAKKVQKFISCDELKNYSSCLRMNKGSVENPAELSIIQVLQMINDSKVFDCINLMPYVKKDNVNDLRTALELLVLYKLEVERGFLTAYMDKVICNSLMDKSIFNTKSFYAFEVTAVILLIKSRRLIEVSEIYTDRKYYLPLLNFITDRLSDLNPVYESFNANLDAAIRRLPAANSKPKFTQKDLQRSLLVPTLSDGFISSLDLSLDGVDYEIDTARVLIKESSGVIKSSFHDYLKRCCKSAKKNLVQLSPNGTLVFYCVTSVRPTEDQQSLKDLLEQYFEIDKKCKLTTNKRLNIKIELRRELGWEAEFRGFNDKEEITNMLNEYSECERSPKTKSIKATNPRYD
ncbi:MAG: hypothetical protein RL095_3850 [Verrucomicrobiota bacterium]|jgi:hypothetical protein